VAWVAERKDVLSTLFWILTTWAYLRFVENPVGKRRLAMIGLFALGLMSKPMLVTLPFTLLLLDYWPLQRLTFNTQRSTSKVRSSKFDVQRSTFKQLIWEKAPLFAMSAVSCLITVAAQSAGKSLAPSIKLPPEWRLGNALISYVAYLWKMVWPAKLAVLYPWTQDGISYVQAGLSALLLVAISVFIFKFARKPFLTFGWLWYLGTLVPVIGILQVGEQTIADRYTYVPLIGIFIALAWLIPERWGDKATGRGREKALAVMMGLIIAACMASSWVYVGYWKDSISLMERAVSVTSDNYTMHFNLAIAYGDEERWEDSANEYREAIKILPRAHEPHTNLAIILFAFGKYPEAWKEVHICEDLGHPVHQAFFDDLSARMPDPSPHYSQNSE